MNAAIKSFVPVDDKPVMGFTRILVDASLKIRYKGGPLQGNREYYSDGWVLWRRDVPTLTDEQWWETPTGWKEG